MARAAITAMVFDQTHSTAATAAALRSAFPWLLGFGARIDRGAVSVPAGDGLV
jgi:hypothetical protein